MVVAAFLKAHGITILRLAVALVFIWFGTLKVADRSPVAQLVADKVYWVPACFAAGLVIGGQVRSRRAGSAAAVT